MSKQRAPVTGSSSRELRKLVLLSVFSIWGCVLGAGFVVRRMVRSRRKVFRGMTSRTEAGQLDLAEGLATFSIYLGVLNWLGLAIMLFVGDRVRKG
jgi:hypothetical protein